MQKLISIIVPVYKVETYLPTCIDSIINQTYKNIEIILADDGSPDNCPDICDEYAKRDSRIKVIHKENGGLSDARNAGLEIAAGDYIGFVDSDDYIASDMYETLLNEAENNEAEIVMCRAYNVYDDDTTHYPTEKKEIQMFSGNDILSALYDKQLDNFAWNKFYKRSLFDKIRYPKGKIYEDLFTTYKLLDMCNKVVLDNSRLYYYRIRKDSIMGKARKVINVDKFQAFDEIIAYFKDNSVIEKKAKLYMCNDLMSDVFKVIAAGTVKENKIFFDKLKKFRKSYSLDSSKSVKVIDIACSSLWILVLRYKIQKLLKKV